MNGQMKTLFDRMNAMYSPDYKFRDIYKLTTAADGEPEVPKRVEAGLTGWISLSGWMTTEARTSTRETMKEGLESLSPSTPLDRSTELGSDWR